MTETVAGAGSVDPNYEHRSKLLSASTDVSLAGALLKWYDLRAPEQAVDEELRAEARDRIIADAASGTLDFHDELGLVIHHLCGDSVRLLLVCTWRNENELWVTLYTKTGDKPYEIFSPEPHKGTFCVWELGAVWHEQQAWVRYLRSARDDAARKAYMEEKRYEGLVG